jgi:hypothetical protein
MALAARKRSWTTVTRRDEWRALRRAAAVAALGWPVSASVKRIWRWRLVRETTSSSTMTRWPTPAAAR